MMAAPLLCALALAGASLSAPPGAPAHQERRLSGDRPGGVHAVAPAADGSFVTAGYYRPPGSTYAECQLTRVEPSGRVRWRQRFGGRRSDHCLAVAPYAEDAFVVTGYTETRTNGTDAWIFGVDGAGTIHWKLQHGGKDNEEGAGLTVTPQGLIVGVGHTTSKGSGAADGLLVIAHPERGILGDGTFGGADFDFLYDITTLADGDSVLVGKTATGLVGGNRAWVVRLDPGGEVRWQKHLGDGIDTGARAVVPRSDNTVAVAGWWGDAGWVGVIDADGDMTARTLLDDTTRLTAAIGGAGRDSLLVVGEHRGARRIGSLHALGPRLDPSWSQRLEVPLHDVPMALARGPRGSLAVAGWGSTPAQPNLSWPWIRLWPAPSE